MAGYDKIMHKKIKENIGVLTTLISVLASLMKAINAVLIKIKKNTNRSVPWTLSRYISKTYIWE